MATKKAVARKEETPLAMTEERPDFVSDSMRGSENVTSADMTIPRLDILQALSPQIDEIDAKYIPDAKQGTFWNTATSALYGKEVVFVPCFFRKEWVVWRDINKGGGFRGAFSSENEAQIALQAMDDSMDCEVVDTSQHFGLLLHDDSVEEIVLSCSSTKHKPSRKLNTLAQIAGGDRFASAYKLSVIQAENAAGQKYWNFDVSRLGWVAREVYERGEKLYEAVSAGARDVDRRQEGGAGSENVTPEELDA